MIKTIAFYLPQYRPTPHNDEWWGKGFTEWTNVAKAPKLYRGHYQPHIPADLGFYDLRLPEVRRQQAELAKEAGVFGFCYYHYWFGNGHVELDETLQEVVELGEPDFPFCVCWANESWGKKMWNQDGNVAQVKVIANQQYPGSKDNEDHFNFLLETFKDKRYIRINDKPLFIIYRPLKFIDIGDFMSQWNELGKKAGIGEFHFAGYTQNIEEEYINLTELGLDSIIVCNFTEPLYAGHKQSKWRRAILKLIRMLLNRPTIIDYKKAIKYLYSSRFKDKTIWPTLVPNWDHTPRSGKNGYLYSNSTPELFKQHAQQVLSAIKGKDELNQVVFLKSWNEWGEGNYMEPDLKYGKGYIKALREALDSVD